MHAFARVAAGFTAVALVAAACSSSTTGGSSATPTATATASAGSGGIDLAAIPLGDGHYSTTTPAVGTLYICNEFAEGGGADTDGPWIHGDTWNLHEKAVVEGDVKWPDASYDDAVSGDTRSAKTNDLPNDHTTGIFPIASSDPAYQYDRNPNSITAQDFAWELPAKPEEASTPTCLPAEVGIMKSGVVLLNALDAKNRDAVAHEVQDHCDGHPQTSGVYHYHSVSDCLEDSGSGHSALVGYAFDGFGIYGNRGENGESLTNADLDECHGHKHSVEWDGADTNIYHYHSTYEFPYTVGCFKGTPISSNNFAGEGGGAGQGPGGGPPPGR